MNESRNVKAAVVELSKKSNLESFFLQEGINTKEAVIVLLSVGLVVMAAVGAGAGGWLFSVEIIKRPDLSIAITLFFGGGCGVVVGLFILDWLIAAASTSYEARMKAEAGDVTPGRSFARASRIPRTVPLSEQDKLLLQAFARRYPAIRTMGINEWEGDGSPFTFRWLDSKRKGIKRVQSIVLRMNLATRDGRGAVKLNADGEARIADWQNGIFDDEPAPPQNGRTSPVQEVAHE